MSFLVGETVGAYRITEQLGSGGMATVFKAYHAALDRYVAIKVLHPAFKEDPNFLARFQREARVVARLEHPNIVPVYDFSDHNGQPYLVMRYIEGETLKARLTRGRLSMAEAVKIVHAVGAALTYAHGEGVLHRDIKPSNVMLTPKGDVFLADFGLARIAEAGESTLSQDSMLGTPQYISPEQAKGERDLDARTDVYSLGVVVYELLVGRVPYQADTPYAVVHDHIFSPLPLPRTINAQLPEALERFLLKALAKDRADRFESVAVMVAALDRAVEESNIPLPDAVATQATPIAAPTVAAAPRPAPASVAPAKKAISPVVWVALGALIVIALVVVFLIARRPPQPASPPPAPPISNPSPAAPSPDDAAIRASLDETTALFRQASEQVAQARLQEARATFERAARRAEDGLQAISTPNTPEEGELHTLAAESWLASGHPDGAEGHLAWLADRAPDQWRVHTGLAIAHLLQGRVDDALGQSGEAVAANPDAPEAHAIRACALLKKGDPVLAAREFRLASANRTGATPIPPWLVLVMEQLDCRFER